VARLDSRAIPRAHRPPGVGVVESWVDVTVVRGALVSFRWTFVFSAVGAVLTSASTLRFDTARKSWNLCRSADSRSRTSVMLLTAWIVNSSASRGRGRAKGL
jgi:hypothetical protein